MFQKFSLILNHDSLFYAFTIIRQLIHKSKKKSTWNFKCNKYDRKQKGLINSKICDSQGSSSKNKHFSTINLININAHWIYKQQKNAWDRYAWKNSDFYTRKFEEKNILLQHLW